MNDNDFDNFAQAWAAAYELCSRGKVPSPGAISLAFDALSIYRLDQVTAALTAHLRSPASKYGLTPGDICQRIDGNDPTVDQVIGAAMEPTTALAVLCRIEIGSYNLDSCNRNDLRPLAERCLAKLPGWKRRIAAGELTAHEKERCLAHGVRQVPLLSANRMLEQA